MIVHDDPKDFQTFMAFHFGLMYVRRTFMLQVLILYSIRPTTRQWISLLTLSRKYCVRGGFEQAVMALETPAEGPFAPAFKLRLAWEFDIESWYDEPIRALLTCPYDEITALDLKELESDIAAVVIAARFRCLKHRNELVPFTPEAIHCHECPDRGGCVKNWQTAFQAAMLFFTHTRKYYSGRDVFAKLNCLDIPCFSPRCRELTMQELEVSGVLWREETFIAGAAADIHQILQSLKPERPQNEPRFRNAVQAKL